MVSISILLQPGLTLDADPELVNYQNIGLTLVAEQTRRAPNSQEDASEFFVLAFNALKNSSSDLNLLISNHFGFFQTKKTECRNPFDTSQILMYYSPSAEQIKLQNPEYNLSLPIISGIRTLNTIDECLEEYFKEETFNDPKNYISFQGNIPGLEYLIGQPVANCIQKTYLINAPEVLLISFKRTGWDYIKRQPVRLSHPVAISSLISIRNYIKEPIEEELYEYTPISIIVQRGVAEGGHYLAYIKDNGTWYECNDLNISPIKGTRDNPISAQMQKEINDNAYVIFYKKISLSEEPGWAKKIHELKENQLRQKLTKLTNTLQSLQNQMATI